MEQQFNEEGIPIIPKRKPILTKDIEFDKIPLPRPDGIVAICGECGLRIARIMGYCCPNPNCPCGLGSGTRSI